MQAVPAQVPPITCKQVNNTSGHTVSTEEIFVWTIYNLVHNVTVGQERRLQHVTSVEFAALV